MVFQQWLIHHFLGAKSRYPTFGSSLKSCKSLLRKLILKDLMRQTSIPIFSPIGSLFAISQQFHGQKGLFHSQQPNNVMMTSFLTLFRRQIKIRTKTLQNQKLLQKNAGQKLFWFRRRSNGRTDRQTWAYYSLYRDFKQNSDQVKKKPVFGTFL